ncbi:zinc finger MYM-type protein 1-like [Diabrotica virgifera virgifera]|uniref:Zinc finger MYM-type protein 1-like n=1 Tax=Diabrotica virgifera virgifera TaxID=50390 RepID=A0ABM5K7Z6_DIAVI|nr:zinc finger MYM-type protein 1-like [Diabrotica virgifera virgifera]XP_050506306.1 zinc finger MYM-type protein 1-like [Diabrotica virgifera virgifera]
MLLVCREEIFHQIEKADFLSIQCDETTDVSNNCQMVLILRYFYEDSIYENFWGLLRVMDKTAAGLKTCIENEIDPLILKTPQKLIAQTYDGANVMSGSTSGVQIQIKQKYPSAHFIHCYAHQLNLIMQKAASQNPKVRVFFNNLSAIPAFFSNSSHRCDILEEIVNKRLPRVAVTRWNYNIRTVNSVYENREKLIEVFKEVEDRCEKSVTSNEASGLRRALEDPEFMFWLTIFHKVLPQVDILYNQLQSRNKDSVELKKDLEIFEQSITNIRNDTDEIKESVESNFESAKRRRTDDNMRSVIAKEVCDVITTEMKERFSYRGHLQAAELFNKDMYSKYSKTFPVNP